MERILLIDRFHRLLHLLVNDREYYIAKEGNKHHKADNTEDESFPCNYAHLGKNEICEQKCSYFGNQDETADEASLKSCFKGECYQQTVQYCEHDGENCLQDVQSLVVSEPNFVIIRLSFRLEAVQVAQDHL